MYALGYVKELAEEGFPEPDKAETFMKLAYQQPGRLQMPDRPQIDDGLTVNCSNSGKPSLVIPSQAQRWEGVETRRGAPNAATLW